MTLDEALALEACSETFERAAVGALGADLESRDLAVLKIAVEVLRGKLSTGPQVSFDTLDEVLLSESPEPVGLDELSDVQYNHLLWQVKRSCLHGVVNGLPLGERFAFVATSVLGLDEKHVAALLAIAPSALKVRLSRARQKLGDFLAPRCGRVEPLNPCQCPNRVGGMAGERIVPLPSPERQLPDFNDGPRRRDAVSVFGSLPLREPPAELRERIAQALASEGRFAETRYCTAAKA